MPLSRQDARVRVVSDWEWCKDRRAQSGAAELVLGLEGHESADYEAAGPCPVLDVLAFGVSAKQGPCVPPPNGLLVCVYRGFVLP